MSTGDVVRGSSPSVNLSSRNRLPTLTGLRFWAALLVVAYHLTWQIGAIQPISALAMFGRTGVTFFFVLSGFVLAWTYLDSPTRVSIFLWRRFARLWPLVVVTSAFSLLVFQLVDRSVGLWQAATTILFLQAWHPRWAAGANGAAWSLSAEAFFYLMFPPLLGAAAVNRARSTLWLVSGLAMVAIWSSYAYFDWPSWAIDYLPPSRIVQFVVGVLCAVALRRGTPAPLSYRKAAGLVALYHAALIPWAVVTGTGSAWGPYSGSQWWATPLFALLIMAAASSDLAGRPTALRGRVTIRLGQWSFAWYLVHEQIIRLWTHFGPRSESVVMVGAGWVAVIGLSVSAAGCLYKWVEHPAERWLRRHGPQPEASRHSATRDSAGEPRALPGLKDDSQATRF